MEKKSATPPPRIIANEPGWIAFPERLTSITIEFKGQPAVSYPLLIPDGFNVGEHDLTYADYGHTRRMGTQAFWRERNGAAEVAVADYFIDECCHPDFPCRMLGFIRKNTGGPITLDPHQLRYLQTFPISRTNLEVSRHGLIAAQSHNRMTRRAAYAVRRDLALTT